MPTVLITPPPLHGATAPHVSILTEAGFEIRYPKNLRLSRGGCDEAETIEELRGVHATIAGGEFYTERVLEELPDLRVIARAGVGFDRVDVAAATARRIPVTITPTANHDAVAEHAFALLLAVAKDVINNQDHVRCGEWAPLLTRPVRGMTLGIVGLGRVGRSVARACGGVRDEGARGGREARSRLRSALAASRSSASRSCWPTPTTSAFTAPSNDSTRGTCFMPRRSRR